MPDEHGGRPPQYQIAVHQRRDRLIISRWIRKQPSNTRVLAEVAQYTIQDAAERILGYDAIQAELTALQRGERKGL